MAAPAFGFSAGDFVEAIKIISKVTKALKDATGATAQYRRTVIELETLTDLLRRAQQLQPGWNSDGEIVEKVHYAAHACYVPVIAFANKIQKYDACLSQQPGLTRHPSNRWVRGARKAQWALQVERELEKLKASIGPYLQAIEIYLQLDAAGRAVSIDGASHKTLAIAEQLVADSALLKVHVTERVASHIQVEPIMPALERIVLNQQQMLIMTSQRFDALERLLNANARPAAQSQDTLQITAAMGASSSVVVYTSTEETCGTLVPETDRPSLNDHSQAALTARDHYHGFLRTLGWMGYRSIFVLVSLSLQGSARHMPNDGAST